MGRNVQRGLRSLDAHERSPVAGPRDEPLTFEQHVERLHREVVRIFGADVTLEVRQPEADATSPTVDADGINGEAGLSEEAQLEIWRRRLTATCPLCGVRSVVAGRCQTCGAAKRQP